MDIYSNSYFLKNNYCRKWLELKLKELSIDNLTLIVSWLLRIAIDNTILFKELIFLYLLEMKNLFILFILNYYYMSDKILKEKLYNEYLYF